ncbi:hypothetical protein [Pedobacter sp.]
MKRSYYQNAIDAFRIDDVNSVFGKLAKNHQHELEDQQKKAWLKQIEILKYSLTDIQGNIILNFLFRESESG